MGAGFSPAAPVKRLSRHNRVPVPLFHGPPDRLVFQRMPALPITGSRTSWGSSCRERFRHDTLNGSNIFLTVPLGLCPSPGLPEEPGQTAGCFFSNSGVRQTLSGATSRMFSAFSSDSGSMSFARAYGVIPPRLSLGALLMWLIIRLMSYCV